MPANIAEGFKRRGKADKIRFLNILQGECRYYLILVYDLGYADATQLQESLDEISRMLDAYMKAIMKNA